MIELKRIVGFILLVALFAMTTQAATNAPTDSTQAPQTVSYYRDIRPIFQARCQGCHQPAKAKGKYVMTDFAQLIAGGDSGDAAIIPGKADKSSLIDLIWPLNGEAEMPQKDDPLSAAEIDLISLWINQGAKDDTPKNAIQRYDMDHPPVYTRAPVISSIDYSANGAMLAVSAFHEVLLLNADGTERIARLVGMSERVQSVSFSPDSKRLAVAGGLPGRMGEVQIWDVVKHKLLVSVPTTFDTTYGVTWSPDGTKIAFGCADNTVRAIDAKTGKQVLFQGAHSDWVLGTTFTADGKHLVSVGRDMAAKLTEVETERFVDNITSITPGQLKGGIQAIARHPQRDEIVIGGSDGSAKVYRIFRQTERRIGDDANLIRQMPPMTGRIFDLAVSADGKRIAVCSTLNGKGQVTIYSYEFDTTLRDDIKRISAKRVADRKPADIKTLEAYRSEDVKVIAQTQIDTAVYTVAFSPDGVHVAAAGADGTVRFIDAASGDVLSEIAAVEIEAADKQETKLVDYIRDVKPVLSRLGCNQGTCHGSAKGKEGFKLSLRGYDSVFDVRALTDDHASRRVNVASPDDSLMLLKPTGAVPHEGKGVLNVDDPYYQILRTWITQGAKINLDSPTVTNIELTPVNPTLQRAGERQAIGVMAIYSDGSRRDVTREAFIESGDAEVAIADREGYLTAVRRGEAPVLARYEGAYAATTLTVMGDREGFVWVQPATWGQVDKLVAAKWQRMKIAPSQLSDDAEFIRRVYLDLTGLPPTAKQVRAFIASNQPARKKRSDLVDKLIGSAEYNDYWTNKWADLLQVNSKFLGKEGAQAFRDWIHNEVSSNTPHDDFARKILTASGSNRTNPAASYYKVLREPDIIMENTTHLFMATRFNCNKCHDHPFERWTQNQYYETAAFFARVGLTRDSAEGNRTLAGTAVEKGKPLYEVITDMPEGEMTHIQTGEAAQPIFPFDADYETAPNATRRDKLAAWITSADNPYFAKSYVNRLWGYLLGVGIIEPIDDIRAGNPPTNPALLDYLTEQFIKSDFNVQHVMALICKSRTYQLSIRTHRWNENDNLNYSHAIARRLPAEVLYDTIYNSMGAVSKFPGVPAGTRAAQLPDVGIKMPDGFLRSLGRPARESACECERTDELQLGPVMALVNGATVDAAITDPNNMLPKLVADNPNNDDLVDQVVMRLLSRHATQPEIDAYLSTLNAIAGDHQQLTADHKSLEIAMTPAIINAERQHAQTFWDAKDQLAAYQAGADQRKIKLDAAQAKKTAQLEKALQKYDKTLPAKLADWEANLKAKTTWRPLDIITMKSNTKAKLKQLEDGSILVSGPNGGAIYTITTKTDLPNITAIKLEALPHESLPSNGPGRNGDGNFVLTEFMLKAGANPGARKPGAGNLQLVDLTRPQSDFNQSNFEIAKAIDGNNQVRGWAVAPQGGQSHYATFDLLKPIQREGGSTLQFAMIQNFTGKKHSLGRFRLWVTSDKKPDVGLPQNIAKILALPAADRNAKQYKTLLAHFHAYDVEHQKKTKAVVVSSAPRPKDPKLIELEKQFAQASQPVKIDATLARMRQDAIVSAKQVDNKRLTAAQDLAWALINSPAFLFNR